MKIPILTTPIGRKEKKRLTDVNLHNHPLRLEYAPAPAVEPPADAELAGIKGKRSLGEIDMTKKKGGKSKIIQDVRATGLTARKAEKAVNTVFDHLKLGL